MTFYCRACQSPKTDRLFFAAFLIDTVPRTGFLCLACHDTLEAEGRVIGYVSSKGGGAEWIAKLFALRSLHDQFPNPRFDFQSIQRIQKEIPRAPLRRTQDLIDRMADSYCWLATAHGGLRTFEGWLFGTTGRQLKLMLDGENPRLRGQAHRARQRSILGLHDAMMDAARNDNRHGVVKNLVGVVAASYSARFRATNLDRDKDGFAARLFLTTMAAQAPRTLGGYRSWEAIETGDPWVVFLATRVGSVRRATLSRVSEMLLKAMQHDRAYRYDVALRALHWDVLVDRCLQMSSMAP